MHDRKLREIPPHCTIDIFWLRMLREIHLKSTALPVVNVEMKSSPFWWFTAVSSNLGLPPEW